MSKHSDMAAKLLLGLKEQPLHHDNGKLHIKFWYYPNTGNKIYKGFNGTLDDEFKKWHKNGKLSDHGFYKNGELDGEYIKRARNGFLLVKCNFVNGNLQGQYIKYYDKDLSEENEERKDEIELICHFDNGALSGDYFKFYYEDKAPYLHYTITQQGITIHKDNKQ